jgi:pimeloyl-ACP methyl ester carboxylesterase
MKEYPVFIPSQGLHLGAVITVPDAEPRAVVLLLTGYGGMLRSQRFALWTKTARLLAGHGIASLRLEWPGVGDSTGDVLADFDQLPIAEAVAAAKFAMSATGTTRLGLAGNCAGARTSLHAVRELPTCESMVLFFLKPLAQAIDSKSLTGRAFAIGQRLPRFLRAPLRALYFARQKDRRGNEIEDALLDVGKSVDLLLMESKSVLAGSVPKIATELAGTENVFELRQLDGTSMVAFEEPSDQRYALESVVDWFARSFSDPGEEARQSAPMAAHLSGEHSGG